MKLYLLKQEENNGYDTFDSMVVAAETPTKARKINPGYGWASDYKNVTVKYIGEAKAGTEQGIILTSFHAG